MIEREYVRANSAKSDHVRGTRVPAATTPRLTCEWNCASALISMDAFADTLPEGPTPSEHARDVLKIEKLSLRLMGGKSSEVVLLNEVKSEKACRRSLVSKVIYLLGRKMHLQFSAPVMKLPNLQCWSVW